MLKNFFLVLGDAFERLKEFQDCFNKPSLVFEDCPYLPADENFSSQTFACILVCILVIFYQMYRFLREENFADTFEEPMEKYDDGDGETFCKESEILDTQLEETEFRMTANQ